jgi:hypothetical protein
VAAALRCASRMCADCLEKTAPLASPAHLRSRREGSALHSSETASVHATTSPRLSRSVAGASQLGMLSGSQLVES